MSGWVLFLFGVWFGFMLSKLRRVIRQERRMLREPSRMWTEGRR